MTATEPRRTTTGRIRSGICIPLEEEANRLLKESLADVTSHSEKRDILTEWKERDRHEREVLASAGFIDPSIRRGMYHRVANERCGRLNSRDGQTRPMRCGPMTVDEEYNGLANIT